MRRLLNHQKNAKAEVLAPVEKLGFGPVSFAPSIRRASEIAAELAETRRRESMARHPSASAARRLLA